MEKSELSELVDRPNETLSAEYKSWLNLESNVDRANLARHIAALSNYGGGYIVFGFEDDMTPSDQSRMPHKPYSRDTIAAICRRYLEPALQCDVHEISSTARTRHTIVVIPPHGATPICAKANGPEVDKKVVGIAQGIYYTRKAGPESAPVIAAAEWHPIIRRCAMHDRAALLGALNAALHVGIRGPDLASDLKRWAGAAYRIYSRDATTMHDQTIAQHCCQFSYGIARDDGQLIPLEDLLRIVEEVNHEVSDRVRTGWSMFYPFTRNPIAPYFATDEDAFAGDFLECRLMRDPGSLHKDMWRVALNGFATLIRPYWEDDARMNDQVGWARRTWLSPFYEYRALAELVRHAQGIAERFKAPTIVEFRCEWRGLEGRQIADPLRHWSPGRVANADERVATGNWPVSALQNEWPEIVAALGAPLIRAFSTSLRLNADFVRGHAPDWQRL